MNFFILAILFNLKHFIADFVIQSDEIAKLKGKKISYLILHSFHQAILTFFILIFFTEIKFASVIFFTEIVAHSIIDHLKIRLNNFFLKDKNNQKLFYVFFGADQLLHQLFYLLINFIVINN